MSCAPFERRAIFLLTQRCNCNYRSSRICLTSNRTHRQCSWERETLANRMLPLSFGATKFIPRVDESAFEAVVRASERSTEALPLWDALKEEIYALAPEAKLAIGKPADGHLSSYYPSPENPPSDAEVEEVQALADQAGVSTLNTRLSKESPSLLTLHIASASENLPISYPAALVSSRLGFTCQLKGGDHKLHLTKVNAALKEAAKHTGNKNRSDMLVDYMASFENGDIEKHKVRLRGIRRSRQCAGG